MSITTVTVACKLPNGLWLEVSDIEWIKVKDDTVARKTNIEKHFVRGSSASRVMESNGSLMGETQKVVAGYGLTPGVPESFWDRWKEENKDYPPFAKGLIFAAVRDDKVRDAAREFASRRSGLEPITPPVFDGQGNVIGELDPRLRRGPQRVETRQDGA